jgi:hypothetical protein
MAPVRDALSSAVRRQQSAVRILTYKRTHVGDPNAAGVFGCSDCMGQVRARAFDAVIGVGGLSQEPRSHGIDGRITWVGVKPRVVGYSERGPVLMFASFLLLDSDGPSFSDLAPELARRMYERNVRSILTGYTPKQRREAESIVRWALVQARKASRTSRRGAPRSHRTCPPKRPVPLRRGCRTC